MARANPNIVITGTPGVGKTTHAEQLARSLGFAHVSVNQIVKDEGFHEGRDEELGSWVVDEDKVRAHHHISTSSSAMLLMDTATRPPRSHQAL
jgi:adenylate kinase